MVESAADGPQKRRSGGIKAVREGVWRIDVECPREPGAPRRRVSRTIVGSLADAEEALVALRRTVADPTADAENNGGGKRQRTWRSRGAGTVTRRGEGRWFVQFDGEPDPVTGERRRHSRTVHGSRADAEAALARLRVDVGGGDVAVGTNARSVRAACELYLRDAPTEKTTLRTDRAATNRLCATVLPSGAKVGDLPLAPRTRASRLQPAARAGPSASSLSIVPRTRSRVSW